MCAPHMCAPFRTCAAFCGMNPNWLKFFFEAPNFSNPSVRRVTPSYLLLPSPMPFLLRTRTKLLHPSNPPINASLSGPHRACWSVDVTQPIFSSIPFLFPPTFAYHLSCVPLESRRRIPLEAPSSCATTLSFVLPSSIHPYPPRLAATRHIYHKACSLPVSPVRATSLLHHLPHRIV